MEKLPVGRPSGHPEMLNPLEGGLIGLAVRAINSLLDSLFGGLNGGSGSNSLFPNLGNIVGDLFGTKQKATSAQATANQAIENTSQVVKQVRAVMNSITAPFSESWMTLVPGQQVSFPFVLLNMAVKTISSSTGGGGAGDNSHSHSISSSREPRFTPAANTFTSAFIQSNFGSARATVVFAADAVTNPCELYVVVARLLPEGDAEIAWVSPNQTPLMSLGRAEWSVTCPQDIAFDELEYMIVGVHQIGAGNVRPLLGIEMPTVLRAAESFPAQQPMTFGYSSVMTTGSIIPKGSQAFTSTYLLWIGIGQRLYTGDPLPRQFPDDFEGSSFKWAKIGSAVANHRDGRFSYYDSNDLKSFYYYPQPLAYQDQRVEAYAYGVNAREQGMMLRGNAAGSNFLALVLTSSGAFLRQWTSVSESGYTALGSYSGATTNTYWAIEAIGDVLTAYQQIDGIWIPRIQIPGVGLTGNRYTGLFCDRASFANSGEWDNFYARDMVELEAA